MRVWFTKTGEASYISHLDLQRVMGRSMRRAGLPVWYSLGFNPHIYMTFALPLSLGQESRVESVDFKTEAQQYDWEAAAKALSAALPRGIEVVRIFPADQNAPDIAAAKYQVTLPGDWRGAIEQYNALGEAVVQKRTKSGIKPLDLKSHIPAVEAWLREGDTCFCLMLPAGSTGLNLNPSLLLQFLEREYGVPASAAKVLRVAIFTKSGQNFLE